MGIATKAIAMPLEDGRKAIRTALERRETVDRVVGHFTSVNAEDVYDRARNETRRGGDGVVAGQPFDGEGLSHDIPGSAPHKMPRSGQQPFPGSGECEFAVQRVQKELPSLDANAGAEEMIASAKEALDEVGRGLDNIEALSRAGAYNYPRRS